MRANRVTHRSGGAQVVGLSLAAEAHLHRPEACGDQLGRSFGQATQVVR